MTELLKDKQWKVRAVTRVPLTSSKSQALKAQGAEVVVANFEDAELLARAIELGDTTGCIPPLSQTIFR